MYPRVRTRLQSQVLEATLPLLGAQTGLHYASDRCPGRGGNDLVRVRVTGDEVPEALTAVRVTAEVAGQSTTAELAATPDQVFSWQPDLVEGLTRAEVRVTWQLRSPFLRVQRDRTFTRHRTLGVWDARGLGFGGWTLGAEHRLLVDAGVLIRGDGSRSDGIEVQRADDPAAAHVVGEDEVAVRADDRWFVFDEQGLHLRTVSHLGCRQLWRFTRDEAGMVREVHRRDRRLLEVDRPSADVIALTTPRGLPHHLHLDRAGWLREVTIGSERIATFEHGADGLLHNVERAGRHRTTFDHAEGRLVGLEVSTGHRRDLARRELEAGHEVVEITGTGIERAIRVERLGDGTIRRTKRCCGLPTPQVTEIRGDQRRISFADGSRSEVRWGTEGPERWQEVEVRTPAGLRLLTRRSFTGDATGNWTMQETVSGRTTTVSFDAATNTETTTTPTGRTEQRTVDEHDRLVAWEPLLAPAGRARYDEDGRPVEVVNGDRTRSIGYVDGRLASTSVDGGQVELRHDALGRVVAERRADGHEVTYEHAHDRITAVRPPGRPATRFAYTDDGAVREQCFPAVDGEPSVRTLEHDADGRVVAITRADGVTLHHRFGPGGRPIGVDVEGGSRTLGYHDEHGGLTAVETEQGQRLDIEYDGFLPVAMRSSGAAPGSITVAYDDTLHVAELRIGDAPPLAFEYDADGLDVAAGDLRIERDPERAWVRSWRVGNVVERYDRDQHGRVVRQEATVADQHLLTRTYSHDGSGRITSITEERSNETTRHDFGFDAAGRLTEVRRDGDLVSTATRDPNGARTRVERDGEVIEASVDAQDRLVHAGDERFRHNAEGEMVERTGPEGTTTYRYDPHGNLVGADLADGRQVQYMVDGLGRRIARALDGEVTHRWLYDGKLHPVAEVDADGSVTTLFVRRRGAPTPNALIRDGRTYAVVTDHLGSPLLVVDAESGEVVQERSYDAFGAVLADSAPGWQPLGFTGGIEDPATGLVHLGARELDPSLARFTRRDPLLFHGGMTDLYGYALHDPVNFVDRTGGQVYECSGDFLPGAPHKWIETSKYSSGQDFVGNQSGYDASWDEYATLDTAWVDHTGRRYDNKKCEPVEDVDEECVNQRIKPGTPIGSYGAAGVCSENVEEVLARCSTNPDDELEADLRETRREVGDYLPDHYRRFVDVSERFWDWAFD